MSKAANDLLACQALPSLGRNLRRYMQRILDRWNEAVKRHLPDAEPLTAQQVRNSIPKVLDQMASALESDDPRATRRLEELTQAHGQTRFHQQFDLRELFIEYRLLRRVTVEEMRVGTGGNLTVTEVMALDVGIDIALQQSVIAYVEHLRRQQPAG